VETFEFNDFKVLETERLELSKVASDVFTEIKEIQDGFFRQSNKELLVIGCGFGEAEKQAFFHRAVRKSAQGIGKCLSFFGRK
jgi:hypothetical protein